MCPVVIASQQIIMFCPTLYRPEIINDTRATVDHICGYPYASDSQNKYKVGGEGSLYQTHPLHHHHPSCPEVSETMRFLYAWIWSAQKDLIEGEI